MLKKFIEERCGRPVTANERLKQNYVNVQYLQSKYGSRNKHPNPLKSRNSLQPAVVMMKDPVREKILKENEMMGSLVIQEKEKRKQMENDMGLIKLAFQSLENINSQLVQKLTAEEEQVVIEVPTDPILIEGGQTEEGFRSTRIKRMKTVRLAREIAVQTEQDCLGEELRRANAHIVQLESQKEAASKENERLNQTIKLLSLQLEENKSSVIKALTRERHSIQNLRKFMEDTGIADSKLQEFIKVSPATKEFQIGSVDTTTSEVFREHILYLMYLMNNQKTAHDHAIGELRQQLALQIGMKEQFQRQLFTCRDIFRLVREQLASAEFGPSGKRELLRVINPLEQLWP